MSRFLRLTLGVVGAAALLSLAGTVAGTGSAAASVSTVPWTDPNAVGYIGFCDANGHQITSGSTVSYPFAKVAVSSTAAPKGYGAPFGRAVLYAYQAIQYVDPSDWSGIQMTGASAFTNNRAPMTQGLGIDPSLFNLNAGYPLHWNGLAQLRIYFTAPDKPEYAVSYPAAAVQIHGKTWTQVGGGKVDCKAGATLSNEHVLPNANKQIVQGGQPNASGNALGTTTKNGLPASSTAGAGVTASPTASGPGPSTSAAASSTHENGSGTGGLVTGLVVVLALLAGGGFWLLRRRRSAVV